MNARTLILFMCIHFAFSATAEERAKQLVSKMTMDEKLQLVAGSGGRYAGVTPAISRLNIPAFNLQDGPQGVGDGLKKVTFWPCTLAAVSSWDTDLMRRYAAAIGWEQRKKGVNIHLGPMVNIARNPTAGRNFESFGEDPHLSSAMVSPYVEGIQSNGIMATVKHFVANNQEINRTLSSSNVGDRALWEIYYPAFHAAVKADVASVMCSYNKFNDTYACENDKTLNVDLKGRMGFKGYVMSDWGATHSTVDAANHGLDQQMNDNSFFGKPLKDAINDGKVPASRLDDMAVRILTAAYSVGIMDTPQTGNVNWNARNDTHDILARTVAASALVLLKNEDDFLPLKDDIKTIAVIGTDGSKSVTAGGGGSGQVRHPYLVTPLQGITNRVQKGVQVKYHPDGDLKAISALAASCDVAIVVVSAYSSEGSDRGDLKTSYGQADMISAVAKVQNNTVVVGYIPGQVLMPWESQVKSILVSLFPGQEAGNALAQVLFGDVNPGGKLPLTFPVSPDQIPAHDIKAYPGVDNQVDYTEGIFVGYRWYDQNKVEPLYPFGHGLSYTKFRFGAATVAQSGDGNVTVAVTVANVGPRAGSEVVQLYLGFPDTAGEPPKVLRRFKKVNIRQGRKENVMFELNREDFQVWGQDAWEDVKGKFTIYIGASSRDIRTLANYIRA